MLTLSAGRRSALDRRGRLVLVASILGLGAPLLARWSDLLPAGAAWALDLVVHWQWFFALSVLVGAGLMAPLRTWRSALLLPLTAVPFLTATASLETRSAGSEPVFTVASANVYLANTDPAPLLQWLETVQADAVVVMEVSPSYAAALEAQTAYPHRKIIAGTDPFGIALLSRTPLENVQVRPLTAGMDFISAQTEFHGKPVTVVALHTMPPLAAEYYLQRDHDVATVLQEARVRGMPAVVAGDFNATPWSSGLQVAQREGFLRTTSLLPTWNSALRGAMGIPIDHVLADDRWQRVESARGPDIGSDHYPVMARLALISGRDPVKAADAQQR